MVVLAGSKFLAEVICQQNLATQLFIVNGGCFCRGYDGDSLYQFTVFSYQFSDGKPDPAIFTADITCIGKVKWYYY